MSEAPPARPGAAAVPRWMYAGGAVVLGIAVLLRFWTRSDMWLDEALTVNIARLPLSQFPAALRQDGSPPLYYFLLHFWMEVFGQGDLAVRSLSGTLGVISLPLTWVAGRRLGGRTVAWTATLLVATSPFAVRYSTENRMYMLIVVLTLVGLLFLDSALKRPGGLQLIGVAVVSGLLLLSHYWCIYLIGAVVLMLAWMSRPGQPRAPAARRCLAAVIAGFLLLAPWGGILVEQLLHTGTPWSQPASFAAMVNAVSNFAGGASSAGRALGLVFFGLAGLGLFGRAMDHYRVELDLRTRPPARAVAWISAGSLLLAIVGGVVLRSAFSERYTAVMFAAFIFLVSMGLVVLTEPKIRYGVLAVATALSLAGSVPNITTNRTQARSLTAEIEHLGSPGDLIVYCPDQLGPAAARVLTGSFRQTTYPRDISPYRVDWVDYAKVARQSRPGAFAQAMVTEAAGHNIWLVWSPDYLTIGAKCQSVEQDLAALRPHSKLVTAQQAGTYYEHANLVRYWSS